MGTNQKRMRGIPVNDWGETKRRRNTYLTHSADKSLEELAKIEGCNVSEFLERLVRGKLSAKAWRKLAQDPFGIKLPDC